MIRPVLTLISTPIIMKYQEQYGLKKSILFYSISCSLGSFIRHFGLINKNFAISFTGHFIACCSRGINTTPLLLAKDWFPPNQKAFCLSIGQCANFFALVAINLASGYITNLISFFEVISLIPLLTGPICYVLLANVHDPFAFSKVDEESFLDVWYNFKTKILKQTWPFYSTFLLYTILDMV